MASLIIGRKTEILDTLTSSQQMLHYLWNHSWNIFTRNLGGKS